VICLRNWFCCLLLLFLCFGTDVALGAGSSDAKQVVPEEAAPALAPRFVHYNRMSLVARQTAAQGGFSQITIYSVPHWSGAFSHDGTVYPFTIVGNNPAAGGITQIRTALLPISLEFDEYADQQGKPLVLDVTPAIARVLQSPNFATYNYGNGDVQFADAVQRAQFASYAGPTWHTQLMPPRVLAPVLMEVPVGAAKLYQSVSGVLYAKIDFNFFASQINTITQMARLQIDELPILVAANTLLYENGDASQCCILGFHTAFETGHGRNSISIQTFAYATWLDSGIFRDPEIADVLPLSHEISEWMNDPFVSNAAPGWISPDGRGCQEHITTGDPVEVLPHSSFEVQLNGFTYHPQTQALLQWFTRESPSSAFDHAYSFPDTSALKTPSQPCE
jgi:hypothetical protein